MIATRNKDGSADTEAIMSPVQHHFRLFEWGYVHEGRVTVLLNYTLDDWIFLNRDRLGDDVFEEREELAHRVLKDLEPYMFSDSEEKVVLWEWKYLNGGHELVEFGAQDLDQTDYGRFYYDRDGFCKVGKFPISEKSEDLHTGIDAVKNKWKIWGWGDITNG